MNPARRAQRRLVAAALLASAAPWPQGAVATHAINPWLYTKLPYGPLRGFTSITGAAGSVVELVACAKRKPGTLNYSSGGNASAGHLARGEVQGPGRRVHGSTRPSSMSDEFQVPWSAQGLVADVVGEVLAKRAVFEE